MTSDCDVTRGFHVRAFVTYIVDDDLHYSCYMHNLGFRDVIVGADISPDEAAELLQTFLGYIVVENPTIHNKATFRGEIGVALTPILSPSQIAPPFHELATF